MAAKSGNSYSGLGLNELILRDLLAAGRTELANERTLLAYIRTALAVFAAGVTFVHFFESVWLDVLGWALIPIGAGLLVVGTIRYRRMSTLIKWMQVQEAAQAKKDGV